MDEDNFDERVKLEVRGDQRFAASNVYSIARALPASLALLFIATAVLAGCASRSSKDIGRLSDAPVEDALEVSRKASEEDAALAAKLMANASGKTVISRASRDAFFGTTYLIISSKGTVIVADPYDVVPGIKADIVTSTHKDYDHNDDAFYAACGGRISRYTLETFTVKDVTVKTIPASHYGDDFDAGNPSDIIYVFEVDGLRIAHLGDISQTKLNDAQLAAIGRIVVAIIIMEDASYYGYDAERSTRMLAQLGPKLAFPTHPTPSVVAAVGAALGGTVNVDYRYEFSATDLAAGGYADGKPKVVVLAKLP